MTLPAGDASLPLDPSGSGEKGYWTMEGRRHREHLSWTRLGAKLKHEAIQVLHFASQCRGRQSNEVDRLDNDPPARSIVNGLTGKVSTSRVVQTAGGLMFPSATQAQRQLLPSTLRIGTILGSRLSYGRTGSVRIRDMVLQTHGRRLDSMEIRMTM